MKKNKQNKTKQIGHTIQKSISGTKNDGTLWYEILIKVYILFCYQLNLKALMVSYIVYFMTILMNTSNTFVQMLEYCEYMYSTILEYKP